MDNEVYWGVIPSDMCSPTWETHTTPDMCFCSGMCFPYPVTIPSDMRSSSWVAHITRDM